MALDWWVWAGFGAFVCALLVVDLVAFALLGLIAVDTRADHVGLMPGRHLFGDARPRPVQPVRLLGERQQMGGDR